jgi:hypothetical protein
MTMTKTRPPRATEATPTIEDEPIECDHLDGDASLIRAAGEAFPGYWSCSRCGTPFVEGTIVHLAARVVSLYGEWVRGRADLAPDLMAAVDRLRAVIPTVTPVPTE